MAGDIGVGVQTLYHWVLLYVLLVILHDGLRRLQARKFIDLGKAIEKLPPLEFSKVSRFMYLDLFGQMPTHEANNLWLKVEKL